MDLDKGRVDMKVRVPSLPECKVHSATRYPTPVPAGREVPRDFEEDGTRTVPDNGDCLDSQTGELPRALVRKV